MSPNGAQILNYSIQSDQDCCRRSPEVDARSAEIAGLEIGVENRFRIGTSTTNGAGEWSEWSRPVVTQLPSLRYVTWNIKRNLKSEDTLPLPDWQARGPIEDIADAIAALEPDVIALQEVTSDQADTIATRLGWSSSPWYRTSEEHPCDDYFPVPPLPWPPGCIAFGNAILSRFAFASTESWILPRSPQEKPDQRKLLRSAIVVEGVRFHLYTTHLAASPTDEHGGESIRRDQAAAVVARVADDRAASTGDPFLAIVMGDFNADPDDLAITDVMNLQFLDITDQSKTVNPRQTLTRRIDYIFVDKEGPWQIKEARVPNTGVLSDHLPVFARL
jgi:endonuclease/exonuclease/phosphatase family metal-dependent hydrolase